MIIINICFPCQVLAWVVMCHVGYLSLQLNRTCEMQRAAVLQGTLHYAYVRTVPAWGWAGYCDVSDLVLGPQIWKC